MGQEHLLLYAGRGGLQAGDVVAGGGQRWYGGQQGGEGAGGLGVAEGRDLWRDGEGRAGRGIRGGRAVGVRGEEGREYGETQGRGAGEEQGLVGAGHP